MPWRLHIHEFVELSKARFVWVKIVRTPDGLEACRKFARFSPSGSFSCKPVLFADDNLADPIECFRLPEVSRRFLFLLLITNALIFSATIPFAKLDLEAASRGVMLCSLISFLAREVSLVREFSLPP